MPQLDGAQTEALTEALVAAFPNPDDLDAMVAFKLGVSRYTISEDAVIGSIALRIVKWAEAHGTKLTDLVVGALNQNPDNPELQAVAATLGLDGGAGEFYEKIVLENVPITDVEVWRAQMMASERAVCRVEIGGNGIGTGFLVGPSLLITNYHVVDSVIDGPDKPAGVTLRFDYKKNADGKTVQKGQPYSLIGGDKWLAASSPIAELDYALLRVQGKPGEDAVAGQAGAPVRGFLTPQAHELKAGDPLFIIQHPNAGYLKFAPGAIDDPQIATNRVAYTVNTEPGSSGSPCFTSDWTPVALHHWGDKQHNRGVVFSAILQHWETLGIASEIG